jgi:hypothetical protein
MLRTRRPGQTTDAVSAPSSRPPRLRYALPTALRRTRDRPHRGPSRGPHLHPRPAMSTLTWESRRHGHKRVFKVVVTWSERDVMNAIAQGHCAAAELPSLEPSRGYHE